MSLFGPWIEVDLPRYFGQIANTRFYSAMIQPGDLCFDIGANVGQTIEALVGLKARVVAVEPNPQCLPILSFHFRNDPSVRIVAKAVGAVPGYAMLRFHGTESTETDVGGCNKVSAEPGQGQYAGVELKTEGE